MAKYLVLVELDTEKTLLTEDIAAIGAVGEHVTVEKAVNLECVERKESVRVKELVWGPDDTYPQVSVQPFKFNSGQWVEVILLPADAPSKTLHLTAIIRKEEEGYDPTTDLIGMKTDMDEMAGRNDGEKWRYCEDCKTVFDFWKYDDLEAAGHEGHNVRMLTPEEHAEAVKSCEEAGCHDE